MKSNILNIAVAAVLVLAIVAGVYLYSSRTSANSSCYANAGEVCPPDGFISDYKDLVKLRKEIDAMEQSSAMSKLKMKSDQFRGMGQRLGEQIPQGHDFDEKSMKFVPRTAAATAPQPTRTIDAPPSAPAAAPVPAPVAPAATPVGSSTGFVPAAPTPAPAKPEEKKH